MLKYIYINPESNRKNKKITQNYKMTKKDS